MRSHTNEEVDTLAVRVDDFEEPLESVVDYSARFRKALPHFPHEIIAQWFYEHRQAIYQNSWLRYVSALKNFHWPRYRNRLSQRIRSSRSTEFTSKMETQVAVWVALLSSF